MQTVMKENCYILICDSPLRGITIHVPCDSIWFQLFRFDDVIIS